MKSNANYTISSFSTKKVKVTAKEAITNLLYETVELKPAQEPYRSFDHSEERCSSDLFSIREGFSEARAKFEAKNQEKYQAVVELCHFKEQYGRTPTDADKPTVNKMAEQLTKLAEELFEERAIKDYAVPSSTDISIKAYEEFSARIQHEKPREEMPEFRVQNSQDERNQEQIQSLQPKQRSLKI